MSIIYILIISVSIWVMFHGLRIEHSYVSRIITLSFIANFLFQDKNSKINAGISLFP